MNLSTENLTYFVDKVNTDLKLIKQFNKKPNHDNLTPARSIKQLSLLIKKKVTDKNYSYDQKQKGIEWISMRGFKMDTMLQGFQKSRESYTHQKQQRKCQYESYFNVPQLSIDNHHIFMSKSIEYGMFNLMKNNESNRREKRRQFMKLLSKLNHEDLFHQHRKQTISSSTNENRNESRKKYQQIIKQYIQNINSNSNLLEQFYNSIPNKIWSVLRNQKKGVQQNQQNSQTVLMINTLSLIQSEFAEQIPVHTDAINYYLNDKYFSRMGKNDHYEKNNFWAKCFLYFRAGKYQQFLAMLRQNNDQILYNNFEESLQKIKNKRPQKIQYDSRQQKKDIFYDQLIYALKGESKYSSDVLSNPLSLDVVWILIRNIGIFIQSDPFDRKKFNQIRSNLIKKYRQSFFTANYILFIMYMLDYETIVSIGPNQLLSRDDFVHLLVILYQYRSIFMKNKVEIETKLTEYLSAYISELINTSKADGSKNYIYYMALYPLNKIVHELSSIIATHNIFIEIDKKKWNMLQAHIKDDSIYADLVLETVSKYVKKSQNYLAGAEAITNLLENKKQQALGYLVQMNIQFYLYDKIYDVEQIKNSEKLADKLCFYHQDHMNNFGRLFSLFKHLGKLRFALRQNNKKQLQKLVENCNLIIVDGRPDFLNQKMLDKLIQFDGFQLYFMFLQTILRGGQKYLSYGPQEEEVIEQIQKFSKFIYRSMKQLLYHERYKIHASIPGIIKIMTNLQKRLWSIQKLN